MINIKNYILIFNIIIFSCTVAPRYNSVGNNVGLYNDGKSDSNKSTKKYKNVYFGVSSWYGKDFHGKLTANGEVYDMYGVTAAHKELPLNTVARVTNIDNGKNIILRINDRGPFVKGRILDCSMGAAKKLGFYNAGTANVKIEIIELGDNEYMHHE
tara:strand:- start:324 stop:791 length:468 start_codon:yes stop_codon:yes gene_type:complete